MEEVSTPTNTGNIKPLEPRKVAFTEPTQDIQQCLTQLAVTTEPISLLDHTGCPSGNPAAPWGNTTQGNDSGCTGRPTEISQGPVPSPNSVSSIDQQTNRGNSFMSRVVCFRCNKRGHFKDQCTNQVYCNFCSRGTHSIEACSSKPGGRTRSTPKFQTERDETDSTHSNTINPAEESRLEILMKSQIDQTKKIEDKKECLNKIKEFYGSNKTRCVTWIVHNQTAAKELRIPLRDALLKTSSGDVYEVIAMTNEDQLESELISYVLENFSDISTREDAEIKLRTIRRSPNEPLLTYNVKYVAIHHVAMECEPIDQKIESTWRNYANTLERDLAGKLNKYISNHKGKYINNLQEVMDRARAVEFKERTNRVYRNRKDEDDATQIKELDYDCYEEIQNFQPRFNSTMKPQNTSQGAHSSIIRSYNPSYNPRYNQQSYGNNQSYSRRYVDKYQHRGDQPRDRIRFEYGDSSKYAIINNLKNIIASLQNNRNSTYGMRQQRYNGEINETDSHEMSIADACILTGAGADTVYEALVIGDYIEEVQA